MKYRIGKEIHFKTDSIEKCNSIPKGNWLVCQKESGDFFLKPHPTFSFPDKIYGNHQETAERVLHSYKSLGKNVGALFSGLKGNGKTLTAKLICHQAKLPVLFVTQPFSGEGFQSFLSGLGQDAVLFFDEFEKVYSDEEKQQELLPLLDGVFQTKILFLLTTNSLNISSYLKNRPNRIRYLVMYEGVDAEVQEEVIEENLKNKEYKDELLRVLALLSNVSMDVLMQLIEEVNLFEESPIKCLDTMNIQLEHNFFDVRMYLEGTMYKSTINYNPLTVPYIWVEYKKKGDNERSWTSHYECKKDQGNFVIEGEKFIFRDKRDNEVIFTPISKNGVSLSKMIKD